MSLTELASGWHRACPLEPDVLLYRDTASSLVDKWLPYFFVLLQGSQSQHCSTLSAITLGLRQLDKPPPGLTSASASLPINLAWF